MLLSILIASRRHYLGKTKITIKIEKGNESTLLIGHTIKMVCSQEQQQSVIEKEGRNRKCIAACLITVTKATLRRVYLGS